MELNKSFIPMGTPRYPLVVLTWAHITFRYKVQCFYPTGTTSSPGQPTTGASQCHDGQCCGAHRELSRTGLADSPPRLRDLPYSLVGGEKPLPAEHAEHGCYHFSYFLWYKTYPFLSWEFSSPCPQQTPAKVLKSLTHREQGSGLQGQATLSTLSMVPRLGCPFCRPSPAHSHHVSVISFPFSCPGIGTE